MQSPPLAANLAFGCDGPVDDASTPASFVSQGRAVLPASLFRAQLEDRIGAKRADAVLAIGALSRGLSRAASTD